MRDVVINGYDELFVELYGLPFNEYSDKMIEVLESFGFKEFYGKSSKNNKIHGRLDIDKLVAQ